jgi:hypothetical protein
MTHPITRYQAVFPPGVSLEDWHVGTLANAVSATNLIHDVQTLDLGRTGSDEWQRVG